MVFPLLLNGPSRADPDSRPSRAREPVSFCEERASKEDTRREVARRNEKALGHLTPFCPPPWAPAAATPRPASGAQSCCQRKMTTLTTAQQQSLLRQLEYYFSPANFGSLPLSIPATGSTAVGRFVHSLLL